MNLFYLLAAPFSGRKSLRPEGMRVLVIGGSGHVGRLILPFLADKFSLTIYDLKEPSRGKWKFFRGDVLDAPALSEACRGKDAMIYLAMGAPDQETAVSYDINAKGVHFALDAAVRAGMRRVIYASTLSVYEDLPDFMSGGAKDEEVPVKPKNVYGLTKFLGEEVCRFFSVKFGLPVFVMRLFKPVSENEKREKSFKGNIDSRLSAPDLAHALSLGLSSKHPGFEILHITGDRSGKIYSHEKAEKIIGWEPLF